MRFGDPPPRTATSPGGRASRPFSRRLPAHVAVVALCGSQSASQTACSDPPDATVALTFGAEADALTRTPPIVRLVFEGAPADGPPRSLGEARLPQETVTLPAIPRTPPLALVLRGYDEAGGVRLLGRTLPVDLRTAEGATIPLFAQRTAELARMPGSAGLSSADAAIVLSERYLLLAEGARTAGYDAFRLAGLASAELPVAPRSVVPSGPRVLVLADGGASRFDPSSGQAEPVTPPPGGTFAEVEGGQTIATGDGGAWVVGATRRSGSATARVLRVARDGTLSFASLLVPRLGAAATWVGGRGLVVVGGSNEGAGVELLARDATSAVPLPYPPDPITSAVAAPLDTRKVALFGGAGASGPAGARVLDLDCAASCAPLPWSALDIGARDVTFALPVAPGAVLVLTEDARAGTGVLRVDERGVRDVPLRIARRNARAVAWPTGAVVVAGGGSDVLESYWD